MTPLVVTAAICAGIAAGAVTWRLFPPPRSIARQVAPYTAVARAHLGLEVESIPEPIFSGEVVRRVLGPLGATVATRLSRILGLSDRQALELKLRQAGQPITADQYRRRHLQYTIGSPLACGLAGWVTGSTTIVVILMAAGAFAGARVMPDRIRKLTRRRCERIRSDLPTLAWMLVPKIRNRMTVVVATRDLTTQGSGPVVDDLTRALALVAGGGFSEHAAFELIAKESPEPAAARFYTVLANAVDGGIDLAATLLATAKELRTQRREEVKRNAGKKQMAMIIPDLAFMAPVLLIFLVAPVKLLLFGTH